MVFVSREPIIPNIWWSVTFDVFEMMLWFWIQVNNFEKVSFIYILPKNLNKKKLSKCLIGSWNKPERAFASKCDVGNRELDNFKIRNFLRNCLEIFWIFSEFWGRFFLDLFWRNFFGGIFLGGIFCLYR